MYERRWPLIAAVAVGVVVAAAIGWVVGRSSAPKEPAQAGGAPAGAIRVVDGVPIGIEHSRAGALAAADNYVATATETAIQNPARYEQLVRRVYAPKYRVTALREAREARSGAPEIVAAYKNGRTGVAVMAARRLDAYTGGRAQVTTWRGGVVWGPTDKPFSQWFLTETGLIWDGQRWLVEKIDDTQRPAPAPPIRYQDREALRVATFDRELRGMTAPVYGTAP
jgi:hypothetical protein